MSFLQTASGPASNAFMHGARRSFNSASKNLPAAAEVKRLGVVGAGQMGLGIALVAAKTAQIPTTLVDSSPASLDKALAFARTLLAKDVSKNRLSQPAADAALALLTPSTSLSDLSNVDFVIEAVPESLPLKTSIFAQLAAITPPHAILATNTSSISVTKIAAATTTTTNHSPSSYSSTDETPPTTDDNSPHHPSPASRVLSTHFMNPVPHQPGVEIITGLQTSPSTLSTALALCTRLGKLPSQSADSPGFLANRILMPYINEAIICLETGVGTREDIDGIMKNGTNVPMGPLRLADFIGLDTCLAILEVLGDGLGREKYRPAVLLRKMVDAGWVGKKVGRGFYEDY